MHGILVKANVIEKYLLYDVFNLLTEKILRNGTMLKNK